MNSGTKRQKKYLIFRGVAGCPVVLLPSCLSGFLSMCKKIAHSAQLNIKVDPLFFGWAVVGLLSLGVLASLHLSGCLASWAWPGVVPLDRVLQVWPGVGLGLLSGLVFVVWIFLFRLYLNFTISAK